MNFSKTLAIGVLTIALFTSCSNTPESVAELPKTDIEKAKAFSDEVLPIVETVMNKKAVAVDTDSLIPVTEKAIGDLKTIQVPELQNKTCQEMARSGVIELIDAYKLELEVLEFIQKQSNGEVQINAVNLARATALQDNKQKADELKISGMNKVGALGVQYCLKNQ